MPDSEKSVSGSPYEPNPIQSFQIPLLESSIGDHAHTGLDSPRINYNDLTDIPAGSPKTATFVIGPSSNSDSDTYDYVTDGTADNVEIQAAVDALPSTGGRIIFREGTYTFAGSSPITIAKNGVTIQGQGKGTFFAAAANTGYFSMGHATTQYQDCVIRDIYFTNNQSGTVAMIDNDTLTKPIANVIITGCVFDDASDDVIRGRSVADIGGMYILDNTFVNWSGGVLDFAIDFTNDTAKAFNLVRGNYFTSSSTTAKVYNGNGNSYTIFTNNHISMPTSHNKVVIDLCNTVSNNIFFFGDTIGSTCVAVQGTDAVTNNYLWSGDNPDVASIAISGCSLITSNTILGFGQCINDSGSRISAVANRCLPAGHGIVVTSSLSNISNNRIQQPVAADNTYSAIRLDGATNCIVMGNAISAGGAGNDFKYGIEELNSADKNIILGNQVLTADTANILFIGANTDVSHNITA